MFVYTSLTIDIRLDLLSTRVYLVPELTNAVVRSEHQMFNTNDQHLLGLWFQWRIRSFDASVVLTYSERCRNKQRSNEPGAER